jgi:hypothetical protein
MFFWGTLPAKPMSTCWTSMWPAGSVSMGAGVALGAGVLVCPGVAVPPVLDCKESLVMDTVSSFF